MYIEKLQTVILCNSGSRKQFWNTVKYLRKKYRISANRRRPRIDAAQFEALSEINAALE